MCPLDIVSQQWRQDRSIVTSRFLSIQLRPYIQSIFLLLIFEGQNTADESFRSVKLPGVVCVRLLIRLKGDLETI